MEGWTGVNQSPSIVETLEVVRKYAEQGLMVRVERVRFYGIKTEEHPYEYEYEVYVYFEE